MKRRQAGAQFQGGEGPGGWLWLGAAAAASAAGQGIYLPDEAGRLAPIHELCFNDADWLLHPEIVQVRSQSRLCPCTRWMDGRGRSPCH